MRKHVMTYNGKEYPSGTIFKIKPTYCSILGKEVNEATFVFYNTDTHYFGFKVGEQKQTWPQEYLNIKIICATDKINYLYYGRDKGYQRMACLKDSQIEGMSIGWSWYIFIMGIGIIFKDFAGLFVVGTIMFFIWRHIKKKENSYYEW